MARRPVVIVVVETTPAGLAKISVSAAHVGILEARGSAVTFERARLIVNQLRSGTVRHIGPGLRFGVRSGLTAPLSAVSRALFESLIVTYWASLVASNANEAIATGYRELPENHAERGHRPDGPRSFAAKITGTDESATVLNHPMMKEARRPKRLDEMATEAGLKKHLRHLVRFDVVGRAWDRDRAPRQSRARTAIHRSMRTCRSSGVAFKAIALICSNRIDGKQTDRGDLEAILKVRLAP